MTISNVPITALPVAGTVAPTDILYVVTTPSTTPTDKAVTVQTLKTSINGVPVLAPTSSAQNTIQPSGDFIPLVLKADPAQTTPLQEWQSSAGAVLASLTAAGVLDLGSHKISSVADPSSAQDAATKHYVDLRPVSLPAATSAAAGDLFYIVASPGTTPSDKAITLENLKASVGLLNSVFDVKVYGATGNGITDDSTAVQNAINAAAVNGGTVFFPPGVYRIAAQLTIPTTGSATANGAYRQNPLIFKGAGGHASGQVSMPLGGSVLKLTYSNATYNMAKIVTYGLGSLTLEDLTLWDTTPNATTPFLYTTNTTLHISRCAFLGATNGTSCAQDAIVLGGTNKPVSSGFGDPNSAFQGYGTTISDNYFNNIRRAVYGRSYCNQVVFRDNFTDKGCGTNLVGGACVEFDGSLYDGGVTDSDYCAANVVIGNYFENTGGYYYQVKLIKCVNCIVAFNGAEDPGINFVAVCRLEGAVSYGVNYVSSNNTILANYTYSGITFSEDTLSAGYNTLLVGTTTEGSVFQSAPSRALTISSLLKFPGPNSSQFDIQDTSGQLWLSRLSRAQSSLKTSLQLDGNASGSATTYLTIGNNSTDSSAFLILKPPSNQQGGIQFLRSGANRWWLYDAGTDNQLFLLDAVNSVMALTFTAGAGVSGSANFGGSVKAAGGFSAWGHAVPNAQPAAPVTLDDVIAIIRGCGLSA